MGRPARCLGIESILVKYRDQILLPLLNLSVHIIEGKLKMLERNPKSEENYSLLFHSFVHLKTFIAILLSRTDFFVTTLYNLYLPSSTHIMEGQRKILEINQKSHILRIWGLLL